MGRVIYRPKGAALEYAALALNVAVGCGHGCTYCYGPGQCRTSREGFMQVRPRSGDFLTDLQKDCAELADAGCRDEILLSFLCDPYGPGMDPKVTRESLRIIGAHGLRATVLTKAGMAACRDFDLLAKYGFRFGTSLVWYHDADRLKYEPNAATCWNRCDALKNAVREGISTWVSMEPVINPHEARRMFLGLCVNELVDEVRFGVDTRCARFSIPSSLRMPFCADILEIVKGYPEVQVIFKESLKPFLPTTEHAASLTRQTNVCHTDHAKALRHEDGKNGKNGSHGGDGK